MHGYKWPINCTRTRTGAAFALNTIVFMLRTASVSIETATSVSFAAVASGELVGVVY